MSARTRGACCWPLLPGSCRQAAAAAAQHPLPDNRPEHRVARRPYFVSALHSRLSNQTARAEVSAIELQKCPNIVMRFWKLCVLRSYAEQVCPACIAAPAAVQEQVIHSARSVSTGGTDSETHQVLDIIGTGESVKRLQLEPSPRLPCLV